MRAVTWADDMMEWGNYDDSRNYRVGQNVGHRLMAIILSNLNRFNFLFIGRFLGKCVVKWILKIPPHLACVATLLCETLIAAKQAINDKLNGSVAQRFSNWGPRRVPMGSARGFRKVVIVCTVFNNRNPYVFKFANISQSLSLSALRGSVAVVWHDRLSVGVS